MVSDGRADFFISNPPTIASVVKELGLDNVKVGGTLERFPHLFPPAQDRDGADKSDQ